MKKLSKGAGGREGLFLETCEPIIPHVFTDHGAVFLLDEAVVVFLVVAAAGEGEDFFFAPDFGGVVDKLTAVIAVELQNRERDGGSDVREGLERPGMGVIEEGQSSIQPEATLVAVRVWTY
jgi:hypothetical protein